MICENDKPNWDVAQPLWQISEIGNPPNPIDLTNWLQSKENHKDIMWSPGASMSNVGWIGWTTMWLISDQDQIMPWTFAHIVHTLTCEVKANHADHCWLRQAICHVAIISQRLDKHMANYCACSIQRSPQQTWANWIDWRYLSDIGQSGQTAMWLGSDPDQIIAVCFTQYINTGLCTHIQANWADGLSCWLM